MEDKFERYAGCSIDKFIKTNKPVWTNALRTYCKYNNNLIDDLISDSIIKILLNIDKYDSSKALFTTWCYTIIMNTCHVYYRLNKFAYVDIDYENLDIVDYEYDYEFDDDFNEVLMLIDNLDNKIQSDMIKMKFIDELSIKEIADNFNMNLSTTKNILYNGLKKINKIYGKKEKESRIFR